MRREMERSEGAFVSLTSSCLAAGSGARLLDVWYVDRRPFSPPSRTFVATFTRFLCQTWYALDRILLKRTPLERSRTTCRYA